MELQAVKLSCTCCPATAYKSPKVETTGRTQRLHYNAERPHSTHGILTPNEAYDTKTEPMRLAA